MLLHTTTAATSQTPGFSDMLRPDAMAKQTLADSFFSPVGRVTQEEAVCSAVLSGGEDMASDIAAGTPDVEVSESICCWARFLLALAGSSLAWR